MRIKLYYTSFFVLLIVSSFSCDDPNTTKPEIKTLNPIIEIDLSNILSEPSGIVYNSTNNSFYIVSDTTSKIFEINLNGNLIKEILVTANDLEGITLSLNNDTIYVVEESDNLITSFLLNGNKINSFIKDVSTNSANGLEGIAFDNLRNLFVTNEKLPKYLIKLKNQVELGSYEINAVEDLSDICYDTALDCFWLISDESKKIIKLSKTGVVLSEWLIPFSKGEGITFVQDKMYIVRDSDSKMYVFNKPS
ncbi:MAG: SdiA-regulated domain-containing protein [Ignavibacteriales bacterium]|nr:SdiA-regulated domain-containing protein [Ignavibacteriales bacterium]